MINAMIIDLRDTVAVAIEQIVKGEEINYKVGEEVKTIKALNDIQIYHKIAIKDMAKGEPVVKYGEHIGLAGREIKIGEHVHVHNVESHRENL